MRSKCREHALRCGEELPGQPSAPTGPGGLRSEGCRARTSSLAEPPDAHAQRVVKPNDRVGPRPHQVPHCSLVAVSHPSVAGNRRGRSLAQQGEGRRAELRSEVQGVELDMRHLKRRGELAGEGRLAGSCPTDDHDPLAPCESSRWIASRPCCESNRIRLGCRRLPVMGLRRGNLLSRRPDLLPSARKGSRSSRMEEAQLRGAQSGALATSCSCAARRSSTGSVAGSGADWYTGVRFGRPEP